MGWACLVLLVLEMPLQVVFALCRVSGLRIALCRDRIDWPIPVAQIAGVCVRNERPILKHHGQITFLEKEKVKEPKDEGRKGQVVRKEAGGAWR